MLELTWTRPWPSSLDEVLGPSETVGPDFLVPSETETGGPVLGYSVRDERASLDAGAVRDRQARLLTGPVGGRRASAGAVRGRSRLLTGPVRDRRASAGAAVGDGAS